MLPFQRQIFLPVSITLNPLTTEHGFLPEFWLPLSRFLLFLLKRSFALLPQHLRHLLFEAVLELSLVLVCAMSVTKLYCSTRLAIALSAICFPMLARAQFLHFWEVGVPLTAVTLSFTKQPKLIRLAVLSISLCGTRCFGSSSPFMVR